VLGISVFWKRRQHSVRFGHYFARLGCCKPEGDSKCAPKMKRREKVFGYIYMIILADIFIFDQFVVVGMFGADLLLC
jgi:hypothetical protein